MLLFLNLRAMCLIWTFYVWWFYVYLIMFILATNGRWVGVYIVKVVMF